jgi:hypothetical protein
MIRRISAALAALALSVPLLSASAIPGLRSSGTLVIQANFQGQPMNVGGTVALYHKGSLYRLDVLTLGFPGTSSDLSALAASLIGPGGVSLVYDGATGALTAWSAANRTYYAATPGRTAASGAPASASSSGDPLSALANLATSLRDVQSATIQMLGHTTVNGHPATDLDVQMKRQQPGKALEDYHARLALADDLGDFPLQIAFQSIAASTSAFGGAMKLDLTSVQSDTPDDSLFAIPQGYTRVSSLGGVLKMGM